MKSIASKFIALAFIGALASPFAASAENKEVVKDARGNTVVDSQGDCVQTDWTTSRSTHCMGNDHSVYFDFNSSTLTREARAKLGELAANRASYGKNAHATIIGYTDTIGGESYNQRLSEKRALNVKRYLESKGVKGSKLEVRGLGESATSHDACEGKTGKALHDCMWQDRRVDIEIH